MVVKHHIEFSGESGVKLSGWLYLPDDPDATFPAISMCHGFAAVKEHGLEPFAEAFAQAGFAVLVHDHRNTRLRECFGEGF
jgi:dipeptidyl aminopeptidase/acylaminoacyl peptidase